eukprot:4899497-Ditylum_brightwellii.AAC.1
MIIELGPLGFLRQLKNNIIKVEELKVSGFIKDMLHWLTPSPNNPLVLAYNLEITQVKYGYKIWKENTATSPAGRYLSLYK